jgi:hypothetical protein
MRQQSSIVAASGGSLMTSTWRAGRPTASAINNGARVDQGQDELQNRRDHEIEILNVHLGRIHAGPGACDTTTVCLGLFAAYDFRAVREETFGCSRYGAEPLEKRMH